MNLKDELIKIIFLILVVLLVIFTCSNNFFLKKNYYELRNMSDILNTLTSEPK